MTTRALNNKIKAKLQSHLRVNNIPFNSMNLRGTTVFATTTPLDDDMYGIDKLTISIDSLEVHLHDLKSVIQEFEVENNIIIDKIFVEL